ncbi:hypothetical protein UlMin_000676 [Ulmus minor]
MMEANLPGCGIKASPHIQSCVKWLKQKYCVLKDMLSLSGFGWNNEQMMLYCDRSVFDEYVKNKTKNKDKAIEKVCSNIGSIAQSIATMVPKLGGLVEVLSTADKEVSKWQGKLMEKLMKVDSLYEDQIIDATMMLASKHDFLRVF